MNSSFERMRERDRDRLIVKMRTDPAGITDADIISAALLGASFEFEVRQAKIAGLQQQSDARRRADEAIDTENRFRQNVTAALCPRGIVFRTPEIAAWNTHAIELAVAHRITVRRREDMGGSAYAESRTIHAPAVTNAATYAIALHEIAHVICPDADSRQFPYEIRSDIIEGNALVSIDGEIGAWRWAMAQASPAWTKEMHLEMIRCLTAYAMRTTDRDRDRIAAFVTDKTLHLSSGQCLTWAELEAHLAVIRGA